MPQAKKSKKAGRARKKCELYRARQIRERNKMARLGRHIKKVGKNDTCALKAVRRLVAQSYFPAPKHLLELL